MNIQNALKKGAAGLLSVAMLFSVAACGSTESSSSVEMTSQEAAESTASAKVASDVQFGEEQIEFGKMTYTKVDDTSATTPLDLELTGDYVQLTDTAAEAVSSTYYSLTTMDLEDGSIVIVNIIAGESTGAVVEFIHIDPTTGKLLERSTCNVSNAFSGSAASSWRDVRGVEGYPEGVDLVIQTTNAAYLFDVDDLSKDPITYNYDNVDTGDLLLTNSDGSQNVATYYNRIIGVISQKIFYSTDEGLFSANIDGTEITEIAKQPEDRDWFALWPADRTGIARPTGETQQVHFGAMQLFDNDTKLLAQLINMDLQKVDTVGMAIIDLETGGITINGYFVEDSTLSQFDKWNQFSSFNIKTIFNYVDDTTVDLLVTGTDGTESYVQGRWDILMDVNTGEVIRNTWSPSGMTVNYEVEAVDDSYKGVTGKCTFFNMKTKENLTSGLNITQSGENAPQAISESYGLFRVTMTATRDESGNTVESDSSKKAFYLVPIVMD